MQLYTSVEEESEEDDQHRDVVRAGCTIRVQGGGECARAGMVCV